MKYFSNPKAGFAESVNPVHNFKIPFEVKANHDSWVYAVYAYANWKAPYIFSHWLCNCRFRNAQSVFLRGFWIVYRNSWSPIYRGRLSLNFPQPQPPNGKIQTKKKEGPWFWQPESPEWRMKNQSPMQSPCTQLSCRSPCDGALACELNCSVGAASAYNRVFISDPIDFFSTQKCACVRRIGPYLST